MTKKEKLLAHVEALREFAEQLKMTDDIGQTAAGYMTLDLLSALTNIIEYNCL